MNINHNKDSSYSAFMQLEPKISVIGVGGGGGNAVNNLIKTGLKGGTHGINYIATNTDTQALNSNLADKKIQLGINLTKGFGAGGIPDVGRDSAIESRDEIIGHLYDSDMVFITSGMGGGTGSGAAPMIAQYLKEIANMRLNKLILLFYKTH